MTHFGTRLLQCFVKVIQWFFLERLWTPNQGFDQNLSTADLRNTFVCGAACQHCLQHFDVTNKLHRMWINFLSSDYKQIRDNYSTENLTTTAPAVPSSKMPVLHSFHKSESSVNAIICIKPNTCTLVPGCEASSVFASNQGSLEQRRVECSPACLFNVIM